MSDLTNNGNTVINSGLITHGIIQTIGPGISKKPPKDEKNKFPYDVAISYAGEQERTVSRVASILKAEGFKVFFAPDRESEYIADNLFAQLYRIYRYECHYVAAFVTEDYLRKDYTMHEAATAMLRQREEGRSCLIPIYFEKAVLPDLDPDIHYIIGDGLREVELADKIRLALLGKNR